MESLYPNYYRSSVFTDFYHALAIYAVKAIGQFADKVRASAFMGEGTWCNIDGGKQTDLLFIKERDDSKFFI